LFLPVSLLFIGELLIPELLGLILELLNWEGVSALFGEFDQEGAHGEDLLLEDVGFLPTVAHHHSLAGHLLAVFLYRRLGVKEHHPALLVFPPVGG